jgi:pyruvate/2-oxoglutarate dehydrogenase complex dihydrolipoamide acyltransferase (E2) component
MAASTARSPVPQATVFADVDARALLAFRREVSRTAGLSRRAALFASVSVVPAVVAAVGRAAAACPLAKAALEADGGMVAVPVRTDVGVVVSTSRGSVVPIVRGADLLTVSEVAREVTRLASAARRGALSAADVGDAGLSISPYGGLGVRVAAPLVRPGEAVMVGLGEIADRPAVVGGEVVAVPLVTLAVAADHRLLDGVELAAFLGELRSLLADPAQRLPL